jgi:anaerobic magnesium-protoporphyrin IX monomethyl ester cyclase
MKITLIQPFTDNYEPPLSLAFLAGPLKMQGHHVRIIDMQRPEILKNWESNFLEETSDMVGITANTPQIKQAHEIAKRVKDFSSDVPVILGGPHATLLPEQTFSEFPAFDLIVMGEGEETMVELASRLEQKTKPLASDKVHGIVYRSNGKIVFTPPRQRILDLDSLHEHYDFNFYLSNNTCSYTEKAASLIVSRGCPLNCRFCATNNFWTKRYIQKTPDGVINEIRYVMGRGSKGVVFRDSTFNINNKWVQTFCEKIIKEKIRFKWTMNARVDLANYDSFCLMKKAGLDTVFFGVESGSPKMLNFYGKEVHLDQTRKAFEICRSLKIHTGAFIILGAPPETREDLDMTYKLLKVLKPTYSLVFLFMPLPGSDLYQHYIDQGYQFDYSNIRSDRAIFESAGMRLKELESLRKKWHREFNPGKNPFRRFMIVLLGIRSLNDLKRFFGKIARRLKSCSRKA